MRNKFDLQLELLNRELIEMGALCERSLRVIADVLHSGALASLEEAIKLEEEIDHMESEIEQLCLRLLLQQQPVARDLRLISAALKMISDLERIGDQAADISDLAPYIANSDIKSKVQLHHMAKATIRMVTGSVDAFVNNDLEQAGKVIASDDIVDDLFNKIKEEILVSICDKKEDIKAALDILMAAKYFERIGDHAVNVAEWVEYSITGIHQSSEHHLEQ